ncbi:MAG: hypothetical protein WBJ77_04745, partial [Bacillota bacterium]
AECEILVQKRGQAVAAMDAQSLAHLLIIVLIAFRNIPNFFGAKQAHAQSVSNSTQKGRGGRS